jgi:LysR family transcriptional regulator, hydrogen peroxide-inducible genes activator
MLDKTPSNAGEGAGHSPYGVKPVTTQDITMPSLRQLEYLVALTEHGHFKRAADQVGVSQPTLSVQVSELEKRLGVQLIERSRAGLVLTPIGDIVVVHARAILDHVRAIREAANVHHGGLAGVLKLGIPPSIGPYLLPYLIAPLHRTYPELKLYVREDVPVDLPDGLEAGRYDLLITPIPTRPGDFVAQPLFREPLHLIVPADHPLAAMQSIPRTRLSGEAILALGPGHQLRTQVAALCEEFGAELATSFEGTSLDTLRQMVGMGLGLTFLPDLYVRREMPSDTAAVLIKLEGRPLYRTIGISWRRSSAQHADFAALADLIRAMLRQELPDLTVIA